MIALPPPTRPSSEEEAFEAMIEARVAARARDEARRWRCRLIAIETLMLGLLVAAAGIAAEKPLWIVLRASLFVASCCFASGWLLIGLSSGSARLWAALRRRGGRGRL